MIITIPGGGGSLFQCFSQFIHGKLDLHLLIRQEVVQELLDNREKYHLPKRQADTDDTPYPPSLNESIESDDDFIGFHNADQINSLSQQILTQLQKSLTLIDKLPTSPIISPNIHLPQSTISPNSVNDFFSFHLDDLFVSPSSVFSIVSNSPSSFTSPTSLCTSIELNLNSHLNISPVSPQRSSIISYTPLTITNRINTSDIPPIRRCFRRLSSENILFSLEESPINTIDNNSSALISPTTNPSLGDSFLLKYPIDVTKSSPVFPISDTDIGVIKEFLQSFDEQGTLTHSTPTQVNSKKKNVHWAPSVEIEGILFIGHSWISYLENNFNKDRHNPNNDDIKFKRICLSKFEDLPSELERELRPDTTHVMVLYIFRQAYYRLRFTCQIKPHKYAKEYSVTFPDTSFRAEDSLPIINQMLLRVKNICPRAKLYILIPTFPDLYYYNVHLKLQSLIILFVKDKVHISISLIISNKTKGFKVSVVGVYSYISIILVVGAYSSHIHYSGCGGLIEFIIIPVVGACL
ncbi:hypothetical protein Avbf_15841 [Armadillidium vulgare]|nr:hypothetical protein Avbf_15841 [Armadillidium vulgare]